MHARSAAAWQQPFLNVFRHFRVDEWKRAAREGDVAAVAVMQGAGGLRGLGVQGAGSPDRPHPLLLPPYLPQDQTLRCRVYRIRGAASASNYLQLPPTGSQSLGLTGRYLYVLFRPLPGKHFVIHLDVATEVWPSGWGTRMGNGGTRRGRISPPLPSHSSPPDFGPIAPFLLCPHSTPR